MAGQSYGVRKGTKGVFVRKFRTRLVKTTLNH